MYEADHLEATTQTGLAIYYFVLVLLNLGFAIYQFRVLRNMLQTVIWTAVAGLFLVHMAAYWPLRLGWQLSESFCEWTTDIMGMYNGQAGPILYTVGSVVAFVAFLYWRQFFTRPLVAWTILNLGLWASGWSMTNESFRSIVTKPDNVPITILIVTVAFFTWLAFWLAVRNDERMARGEPPLEKLEDDKVLVWPDLVYTEMIAMIIGTFVLVVWSVSLEAPLEGPATSAKAPNPSKAPWYFLGLQEMLVYYDPWMAGVVLPTMIIVGLVAIPYIDFNQKGNGYYTFTQRSFAVTVFLLGFVVMWVTLIVLGTFLRGPNWNFFGPFEPWNPHKVLALNNINLSEIYWVQLMKTTTEGMPWYKREWLGIVLVLAYMILLPPILARVMRTFFIRMGFLRFFMLVTLIQFMAALPIKMVLRWTINLKYIVFIPEAFFNI